MRTRPRLKIIATGGTIAGAQTGADSLSYRAGVLSLEAVLAAVPNLRDFADLELEQAMSLGSQDMEPASWEILWRRTQEALERPDIDGVVITHGTDTLEESAYFLHLALNSSKPVVLVGAMRPATAISPDGPMNLYNAVNVAAHPQAAEKGVLVVANDEIHFAREVTKTSTTQVGTFLSGSRGLAGWVTFGRPHFFGHPHLPPQGRQVTYSPDLPLPRVEILYAYAGMGREGFDAAVVAGAQGIVVAGVGAGNLSRSARQGALEAGAKGVLVVRSSRVGSGKVERNIEVDDDALGTFTAEDLNPQKARILLMLALQTGVPKALVQNLFLTH